jgi:hypothetical protein
MLMYERCPVEQTGDSLATGEKEHSLPPLVLKRLMRNGTVEESIGRLLSL